MKTTYKKNERVYKNRPAYTPCMNSVSDSTSIPSERSESGNFIFFEYNSAIYLKGRVYFQFKQQCDVFRANYPLKYNAGDTGAAIGGFFRFNAWYKVICGAIFVNIIITRFYLGCISF